MTIDMLIKLFDRLKSERGTWESHWQELAEHFMPAKATITRTRVSGEKLITDKYDSTPKESLQVFAAGLHSYMTNPSSKWFSLKLKHRELSEIQEIKIWLKQCEDIIFDGFNGSNFNQQIHESYMDFGCFGTCGLYEEEDIEKDIRFYARPISELYIMENDREIIDMLFRVCSYTTRQAYGKWGDKAGEKVIEDYKAGKSETTHNYLQVIMPRHERDISKKDNMNMPYSSTYIYIEKRTEVATSGYEEFPFFIPRNIKVSNDSYGYSQCAIALPDAKTLNSMTKTLLKGAQKQVDPPLIVPHEGYLLPFRQTAGAINYKTTDDPNAKVDTLIYKGNLPFGYEMAEVYRTMIKRTLFVDLFLLLAGEPKMTATEVRERVSEKMLILGPILGRLMSELLDPLIHRTFGILSRLGKLPKTPEVLVGQEYKIEYISPLAKAQRMSEARSINDFLISLSGLHQVDPSILDNLNLDKTAKELGEIYNVPQNILRSDEEVQAIRENRANTLAAQQQFQEMLQAAPAVEKAAQAEKHLVEAHK